MIPTYTGTSDGRFNFSKALPTLVGMCLVYGRRATRMDVQIRRRRKGRTPQRSVDIPPLVGRPLLPGLSVERLEVGDTGCVCFCWTHSDFAPVEQKRRRVRTHEKHAEGEGADRPSCCSSGDLTTIPVLLAGAQHRENQSIVTIQVALTTRSRVSAPRRKISFFVKILRSGTRTGFTVCWSPSSGLFDPME